MKTIILVIMILAAGTALTAVPYVFNYQGYLSDLDGSPLEGNYNLVFRIYDVESGADPALWTETHSLVQVTDGVFSVLLGSLVDLPTTVLEEDALWIGVTVGIDTEIAPRLQVTSTPWAYRAAIADSSAVTGAGGGDGGTVFNVATGSGLTGGPITTSGTISVANGGIGTSHLASNAITGDKVANSSLSGIDIENRTITAVDISLGTITSSEIYDNSITSSDIATDAVKSSEIAADAVGSSEIAPGAVGASEIANNSIYDYEIADEPGVASAFYNTGVGVNSNGVTCTSVEIDIPTTGYVLVTGSCYGLISHANGTESRIAVGVNTIPNNLGTTDVSFSIPAGAASGSYRSPMSTTKIFYLGGPATVTIYLNADQYSGGTSNSIYRSNLSALFVPTVYGPLAKNTGDMSGDIDLDR